MRLGGTPGATVEAQSESSASTARTSHGKPRRQHMAATLLHGPATTCRTVRTHNGQAEAVGASMGTDKMPVRPGRPCAAMAMATRLMAETGMMMPASGSDGSCWSKVAEMQQLRMPPHERQWSTTLLPLSRSRTPPSRSQHLHSCTLEDRVAARISLLGRGCGALGAESANKTSERVVSPFCPLLDPPRFRNSHPKFPCPN